MEILLIILSVLVISLLRTAKYDKALISELKTKEAVNQERIKRFEHDVKILNELYVLSLQKNQELENSAKLGVMGYFGYLTKVQ